MILHVFGNHCHTCHLSCVNSALALSEDNGGLQNVVVDNLLNNILYGLHILSGSQIVLQLLDGLGISINLLSLCIVSSTKIVDTCIQTINLSLVAELLELIVVRAIAVAELIVHAYTQLGNCIPLTIQLTEGISPRRRRLTKNNGRLKVELPSLVSTHVNSEINTTLGIQSA